MEEKDTEKPFRMIEDTDKNGKKFSSFVFKTKDVHKVSTVV